LSSYGPTKEENEWTSNPMEAFPMMEVSANARIRIVQQHFPNAYVVTLPAGKGRPSQKMSQQQRTERAQQDSGAIQGTNLHSRPQRPPREIDPEIQTLVNLWEELQQERASLSAAQDITDERERLDRSNFYTRTVFEAKGKVLKALATLRESIDPDASIPSMTAAFMFGFRQCEEGHNLQRATEEFNKTVRPQNYSKICLDGGSHTWVHPGTSKQPTHCEKCNVQANKQNGGHL